VTILEEFAGTKPWDFEGGEWSGGLENASETGRINVCCRECGREWAFGHRGRRPAWVKKHLETLREFELSGEQPKQQLADAADAGEEA
jgi:hypothetical protein